MASLSYGFKSELRSLLSPVDPHRNRVSDRMRLLETETITLHEFLEPPEEYAILSHVWRVEEVLFHHIQDPDAAKRLRGYTKVASCCALARREGYKWAWIDTCCIDKTSSAELSESLNSMFAWYGKADVCYAYLDDVCSDDDLEDPASAFARSKWFTRGWTLQELIASTNVVFLSKDWSEIGTKLALAGVLEAITGVDAAILMAVVGLSVEGVSVGKRMAWAANRETTREEDRAYSLMGIFGINMPTIYGEGNQAFIRLQHEIIRKTSDHSIFAWNGVGAERERMEYYADYVQRYGIVNPVPELSVTSYGIRMRLPIRPHTDSPTRNTYLAALACSQVVPRGHGRMHAVCLHLEHIPGSVNMYARARSDPDDAGLVFIDLHDTAGFVAEDLYVMEQYHSTFHELAHNVYVAPVVYLFFFHWDVLQDRGFVCVGCAPAEVWDRRRYATAVTDPFPKAACVTILLRDQASGRTVAIILGIEGVPLEDRDAPVTIFSCGQTPWSTMEATSGRCGTKGAVTMSHPVSGKCITTPAANGTRRWPLRARRAARADERPDAICVEEFRLGSGRRQCGHSKES
ncbi:hypothetical protein A0H81_10579 [Grifola frondosa]|uniref:Uncharacterized protein n=1 Tax=Grifola frondosa TaxID=5627 RepID=A0A1C7LXT4_GRIFR|nr:hypothetical protein A0H81_10579 [Grifola frondosa]